VKIRFQADNDLRNSIREGVLRYEPTVDFQSAIAARLHGMPDSDVLRLASEQRRILVTHDENSMPRHFKDFLDNGNRSPGVFMVPQRTPVGPIIESILIVWIASSSAEWTNQMVWLPL
jgi:hypothetical protein